LKLGKALLKRLALNLFTLWIIVSVSFGVMKLAPGNPFEQERQLSAEAMAALEEKFGFTYWEYLFGLFEGNFRYSYTFPDQKVSDLISTSLPVSLELGFWALVIALFFGLLWGALSAWLYKSKLSPVFMMVALIGIAVPNFVLGPFLQLIFGLQLKALPVAGWFGPEYRILPALTLGLMYIAYIARISRTSLMETLSQNYIRTAKAKGLSSYKTLVFHAFRNASIPVVHFLAPSLAAVLTGTMVIEKIFNIPGLGRHFVNSALQRDYPLALAVVILYSVLLLTFNLIADVITTLIDPRIELE
jgi:oligopeptide transport system permease protein